jgi:dynein light intermediate chain
VDLINSIVPPREFVDEATGSAWMQSARSDPAGRLDVVTLQEKLDERLENWQARDGGICPVREELFSQAFDELLRQVTLGCEERGLLQLRVRDEIRMTIAAYQTLYHSSVSFGVKKSTLSELGMSELEQKVESLELEKKQLETTVLELENRAETMTYQFADVEADERKEREDEVEFLKFQIKHLETFLQNSNSGLKD